MLVARLGSDDSAPAENIPRAERLVRPDSQRLSNPPGSTVTLVEFLDLECEACRAYHPQVEQLRAAYGDRVRFVVRYMPYHDNSVAAARAAEAAAAQGRFEDMYDILFENQLAWGEKTTSQKEVFFGYAEDLGLDMAAFERAYDDPATEAKIERDKKDGELLGVEATPTFFLNGEKLSVDDLANLPARQAGWASRAAIRPQRTSSSCSYRIDGSTVNRSASLGQLHALMTNSNGLRCYQ